MENRDNMDIREEQRTAATGSYFTKEQFGVNLYDTIHTIGGIIAIDRLRASAIHHSEGYKLQELNQRRQQLQAILANQFPQLSTSEADQVIDTYPWSAGCVAGRQG